MPNHGQCVECDKPIPYVGFCLNCSTRTDKAYEAKWQAAGKLMGRKIPAEAVKEHEKPARRGRR